MTLRLYDLCGADGLRFSPYCARVKMALAIKGLAYETVPTVFTEIVEIGGAGAFKTVPVLENDGAFLADSFAIAERLEEIAPEPPLFAPGEAGPAAARFIEGAMVMGVQLPAMPFVALEIHDRLSDKDKAYFRESREARLGQTLEAAREAALPRLAEYRRAFHPLRQVLAHHPFLGGQTPLFVDAIAYGSFQWLTTVSTLDWFADDVALKDWFARCRAIAAG